MRSRMRESASTDLREPQGSNPLGPPGPELPCPRNSRGRRFLIARCEKLWSGTLPELSGESGESKYPCQCNPLPELRLRGLDLTRQVASGVSFPLSVPIDGAWPDRFHQLSDVHRLGATGRERKGPPAFWHQGNVGGPFAAPLRNGFPRMMPVARVQCRHRLQP